MGYAKRQLTRGLLFAHFLGLTLSLGAIFTNIMVERHTRGGSLEMLSIGRDEVTLSSRNLIQTGFLITVFSGIAVTLLRYGLRAPLWVWIKLGISVIVLTVVIFALDPPAWPLPSGRAGPPSTGSLRRNIWTTSRDPVATASSF